MGLTLIEVNEVLSLLAVSSAAISWPLHYVCAVPNVVADGKTFEAALAVPDGLPRLTDLWWGVKLVQCSADRMNSDELKCLHDNYDIYTVNDLFIVTTFTGEFMC